MVISRGDSTFPCSTDMHSGTAASPMRVSVSWQTHHCNFCCRHCMQCGRWAGSLAHSPTVHAEPVVHAIGEAHGRAQVGQVPKALGVCQGCSCGILSELQSSQLLGESTQVNAAP